MEQQEFAAARVEALKVEALKGPAADDTVLIKGQFLTPGQVEKRHKESHELIDQWVSKPIRTRLPH